MGAGIDRDDPRVVDHLAVDHDVARRLQDQRAVVVGRRHHHAEHTARQAAIATLHVGGGIVEMLAHVSGRLGRIFRHPRHLA